MFSVDLVRQFSILAEDGAYDRMEQVRCSISFASQSELRRLGSGTIWSAEHRERWFEEVEHSNAFVAIQTAPALEVHVEGERGLDGGC